MQSELRDRFPIYELYYETDSHNKVLSDPYDICMACPTGKKYFIWFIDKICYIIDRNGNNFIPIEGATHNINNTICYGTLCTINDHDYYVIEDIYTYKNVYMKTKSFGERLSYMVDVIKQSSGSFYLPFMKLLDKTLLHTYLQDPLFYDSMTTLNAYITHHIQFRSINSTVSYMNHNYKKNVLKERVQKQENVLHIPRTDLNHDAATKMGQAIFLIRPNKEDDVYHLFAYNNNKYVFTNIAFIDTYKLSVMMNKLFRNIRENTNIELGEESDDEDLFQNTSDSKYVFMDRQLKMRCIYSRKWRKWIPKDVVDDKMHCVSLNQLIYHKHISKSV